MSGFHEILDLCLECKACKTECPLSVDMAALKSEILSHYYAQHGTPLRARLFGHVRTLNRVGAALAPFSNGVARARPVRALAERFGGIDRPASAAAISARDAAALVPAVAPRGSHAATKRRGRVVFLADSFTSYTEPEIGRAAIELLENGRLGRAARGGRVLRSLADLEGSARCGARDVTRDLIAELAPVARCEGTPIVGCEPSCVFTLKRRAARPRTRRRGRCRDRTSGTHGR